MLRLICPMFAGGLQDVYAAWYTEPGSATRKVIHSIKYGFTPGLAAWAGSQAAASVPENLPLDALVPVPLHHLRRRERGFNQARQISCGVSETLGVRIQSALVRLQPGESQTTRSAHGRRELPTETFGACLPVSGLRLMLVDDVITTGSTLNAAARCLLAAGADVVYGLGVAVSRRPGSP